MKGILLKRNNSWFIEYTSINGAPNLIEIHPEYEKCYFLDEDADGGEVEFEIVNKLWGVNDAIISYAKLVKPTVPKLGNEDVPKLGYDVKGGELATFKNDDVREDDVEKLEKYKKYKEAFPNKSDAQCIESLCWEVSDKVETIHRLLEELKAKENTYTEEQVRDLFEIAQLTKAYGDYKPYTFEEAKKLLNENYFQSLKQHK